MGHGTNLRHGHPKYSIAIERSGRWAFAALFLVGGILHFAMPKPYLRFLPPMLPTPDLLFAVSGGAEIRGGIGLLIPRLRRLAGHGLALLLLAVFPSNVYMSVAHIPSSGVSETGRSSGCGCPSGALDLAGVAFGEIKSGRKYFPAYATKSDLTLSRFIIPAGSSFVMVRAHFLT